jgi:hypothetical protein
MQKRQRKQSIAICYGELRNADVEFKAGARYNGNNTFWEENKEKDVL